MGYLHINNLYRDQDILLFKRCYAMEKVHGTSTHISYRAQAIENPGLTFFSGGASHATFTALFDKEALMAKFEALGHQEVTVYGEGYGGKEQGMRLTYGPDLRFIAFDIKIGDRWLDVKNMDQAATMLGLEVVPYEEISTDLTELDRVRDMPSEVAKRRGCGDDKKREGVVLRPLLELTKNNGDRIITKHKQEAFSERATPQNIVDPAKLKVLEEANAIASEWVTETRLSHVIGHIIAARETKAVEIKDTPVIIKAMLEDVYREAKGEIVESKDASAAIGKRTAQLFKSHLNQVFRAE